MARKKILIFALLAVLVVFVAIVGIQHLNTVNTDALLYCPDQLVCRTDDFTFEIREADRQAVFGLVMDAFAYDENRLYFDTLTDDERERNVNNGGFLFDFYFDKPQRFCRDIKHGSFELAENFVFDRIALSLRLRPGTLDSRVIIQYFLNGKCLTFDGEYNALFVSSEINDLGLDQELAKQIIGLLPHEASSEVPLVSNVFPATPDTIMLYVDGQTVELIGEEKEAVYAVVAEAFAGTKVYNTNDGARHSALAKLQGRVMLELRYNRRQQYVADDLTDASGVAGAYSGTVYQSLLLSWGFEDQDVYKFPCNTDFHMAINENGSYSWLKSYFMHHTSCPQLTALYAYMRLRVYL